VKCHYPFEHYAGPSSSFEKLIRITLRGTQYDHLETDGPGVYRFSEVYHYDTAGMLRYANQSWDKGAEEYWYDEQGLILRENKSHGYCDRLSSSTHTSYSYKKTDNGLLRKSLYERFSYSDQGAFDRKISKEYPYEPCTLKAGGETIPLAFWYLDRKSAKDQYDHDSYYLYTHFDWDPMTIEFDDFATVEIIDHERKHKNALCFASCSASFLPDPVFDCAQFAFLPIPRQRKVMIPRCILGHPIDKRVTLHPESVEHLYISPGFTGIEIYDFCNLQSIYLPKSLEEFAPCENNGFASPEARNVTFFVHQNSYAHRMCEQAGYGYVLVQKNEINFAEYFQWADDKTKAR